MEHQHGCHGRGDRVKKEVLGIKGVSARAPGGVLRRGCSVTEVFLLPVRSSAQGAPGSDGLSFTHCTIPSVTSQLIMAFSVYLASLPLYRWHLSEWIPLSQK